eukprot:366430-Chlamydomonas_euryale.AAC.21
MPPRKTRKNLGMQVGSPSGIPSRLCNTPHTATPSEIEAIIRTGWGNPRLQRAPKDRHVSSSHITLPHYGHASGFCLLMYQLLV